MIRSHFERLETLFEQARTLEPDEQRIFLRDACSDDSELLAELTRLLAASDQPLPFASLAGELRAAHDCALAAVLNGGAIGHGDALPDAAAVPDSGERIGRYRLLERIGEGGFGVVYRAMQERPVEREVALKVIKLGMDTRRVVARFEAERQALARMEHANIARVFDGGATETGRPYFVMELVRGETLTEYCDRARLGIRGRIVLFLSVCDAVQHAHGRGIVHRDLKPANVLVTETDGSPTVKVIDFGISKITDPDGAGATRATRDGHPLGTPVYMSPEQVDGGADVDARTDVYSLGVLLYELLTGATPFDSDASGGSGVNELFQVVREKQPPRPSVRVRRSDSGPSRTPMSMARRPAPERESPGGVSLYEIADRRRVAPRMLVRTLRGDLDWIMLRCLEKDRDRRYTTPNDLAADLRRYLCVEPVVARSPTMGYRLAKSLRRNRAAFAAGAVILLLLIGGLAGTSLGLRDAQRANDALADALQRASFERARAEDNERRAADEAARARAEQETAEAVNDFINRDLLALFGQSGAVESGEIAQWRSLLARTEQRLAQAVAPGGRLADKPLVEARIRLTFGRCFWDLRLFDRARSHVERAVALRAATLGERDGETVAAIEMLADIERFRGDFEKVIDLRRRILNARTETFGSNDGRTLSALTMLAGALSQAGHTDEALEILEDLAEEQQAALEEHDLRLLSTLTSLAFAYSEVRRYEEALALHEWVLQRHRERSDEDELGMLESLKFVSEMHRRLGDTSVAVTLGEQVLEGHRRRDPGLDTVALYALQHLAQCYTDAGRLEDAIDLAHEFVETSAKRYGGEHLETIVANFFLANAFGNAARWEDQRAVYEWTAGAAARALGEDHPTTLIAQRLLAEADERSAK